MNHLFESINILPTAKRPNAQFGIAIVHPTQWEKALNQYENYKSIYRNYNWCFKSLKHFETLWEYTACPACKYATDTILISALCKRGQAGNIQNPQRHLSSKKCWKQRSNLLLRSLNHDVLISKANEKRWNVGWLGGASQTWREGAQPNLRAPISLFPCAAPWEICSYYYFSSYCLCYFNISFSH